MTVLCRAHPQRPLVDTAHNILVQSSGIADSCPSNVCDRNSRDAARWYDLTCRLNTGTPTVNQSGSILHFERSSCDGSGGTGFLLLLSLDRDTRLFGFSTAGSNFNANAGINRTALVTDPLGSFGRAEDFDFKHGHLQPGRREIVRTDGAITRLPVSIRVNDMTMWTVQERGDEGSTYWV